MDTAEIRTEKPVGRITGEEVAFLKHRFTNEILEGKTPTAAGALVSYAHFLNREGITSDNYPLYLSILESNNRYAIDAMLEGCELESYLDCVAANYCITGRIFNILHRYKRNQVYRKTLRVLLGYLMKTYASPEEGYQLYQVTIADVNDLGKILDETRDQEDPLNRDILDLLMYLSDLDTPHETDSQKKLVARQAARIRSDYFDSKRKLSQSITEAMLEKEEAVDLGQGPPYVYAGE
jgi:hypothetical protein